MNYLVVEGYQDVAERFAAEAGVPSEVPLDAIGERMEVRKAVHAGRVLEAVERVNDLERERWARSLRGGAGSGLRAGARALRARPPRTVQRRGVRPAHLP